MIDNLTEATRLLNATQLMLLGKDNQPISDLYYALQIAVDAIEELQERREADRWIPVSERLPEDYTEVLITNGYGTVTRVVWNTWYQNEYKDARKEYKAIAWKPLPKPYESEAENLDYQRAVEDTEYCERHEPTYNPDDGSM